ncbi:MAG: ATP-binding cassette domain-containing protein [Bryobacterales bacterium]
MSFAYGEARVLEDVTLRLHPAELTAIVGPNGAGKSTLMGVLAGLLEDYSGACRFDGRDLRRGASANWRGALRCTPEHTPRVSFHG